MATGQAKSARVFATVIAVLMAAMAAIYSLWCTIIAFTGGRLPLIGIELEGSILTGLVWFLFITPIVISVFHFGTVLILLPIAMAIVGVEKNDSQSDEEDKKEDEEDDLLSDEESDDLDDDDDDKEVQVERT